MRNYYYLAGSLPALKVGEKPDISFEDLVFRFETNLTKDDLDQTKQVREFIDLCNIRNLLWEIPIDNRGNLDFSELEQEISLKGWFEDYVYDYLEGHITVEEQIFHFPKLLNLFLRSHIEKAKGFLKEYFTFEREWRLILTALRSKEIGSDLAEELQFEDTQDPFVAYLLAQKDSSTLSVPDEYEDLKAIYHINREKPQIFEKELVLYRMDKIDEMVTGTMFSFDTILAYMLKLMLIEDFVALDSKVGRQNLEKIKER